MRVILQGPHCPKTLASGTTEVITAISIIPAATKPNDHYVILEDSLFLRITNERISYESLNGRMTVKLLKNEGAWSRIQTIDGREGLVPSRSLTLLHY